MQNRKGLSDIVSTVLIILLVVAAIAIIGAIVLNVVNNAGTKVNSAVDCQTTVVNALSCNLGSNSASGVFTVASVGPNVKIASVTAYFTDASGVTLNSTTVSGNPALNTGTQIPSTLTNGKNATNMFVAATLAGSATACPGSTPISCS